MSIYHHTSQLQETCEQALDFFFFLICNPYPAKDFRSEFRFRSLLNLKKRRTFSLFFFFFNSNIPCYCTTGYPCLSNWTVIIEHMPFGLVSTPTKRLVWFSISGVVMIIAKVCYSGWGIWIAHEKFPPCKNREALRLSPSLHAEILNENTCSFLNDKSGSNL